MGLSGGSSNLVSTGIDSLDKVFGGGLLRGSIVLVAGHPGSGKTTLGASFLYHGAMKENEPGVYVSFAESKREFYYHMRLLGMDFEKLEEEGKFKFLEGLTGVSREVLSGLIDIMANAIDEIGARRVVLDPITALLMHFRENEARVFFREALTRLFKPLEITAYLITDLPYGREVVGYGFEEFLADVVLRLIYEGAPGTELVRRRLIIQKSRYSATPRYAYDFEIGKGGIKIFAPIEEIPPGSYELERVSTGIPELDKMLGGGLLKGSLTALSGPSGTGKTVIAMRYAIEGALKGERVVYISYEESDAQLGKLLKAMGLEHAKLKDHLTILYRPVRLLSLSEVVSEFSHLIEKYKPARLVLDGCSALERTYDPQTLNAMLRGISALLKSHGITAIMTSLKNVLEGEEMGYSTIVDTLIGLAFERKGNALRRKIAIIKMRGSPHDRRIREIDFKRGKVIIRATTR